MEILKGGVLVPAAIPGRISTQVRLDEDTWKKVKAIGKLESRNANSQLNYFLKKAVEAYELEHGEVDVTGQP